MITFKVNGVARQFDDVDDRPSVVCVRHQPHVTRAEVVGIGQEDDEVGLE